MKRKNSLLFIAATIFALVLLVVGYAATQSLKTQKETEKRASSEPAVFVTANKVSVDSAKKETLVTLISKEGYSEETISDLLQQYAKAAVWFNMTPEEDAYLLGLLEDGYDFKHVFSVYIYLKKIDDDPFLTKKIYDLAEPYFENTYWLEDAYEAYKGITSLSVEEIYTYTTQGITVDEIMLCNEMSLQTDSDLHMILDERVTGKDWYTIATSCYELKTETLIEVPTLEEVLTLKRVAIQVGKPIDEVYEVKAGNLQLKSDVQNELLQKEEAANKACEALGIKEGASK